MPSWGRPSGARDGKKRKGELRHTRQREEDRRFEEIDSDDLDGHSVNWNGTYSSDELHFTDIDLGLGIRRRQRRDHNHVYSSGASEVDEYDPEEIVGGTMQLALRDKEELLVQRALDRIRRAQMLGRTNVKLTQPEIDALERRKRKDRAKSRGTETTSKGVERRRSTEYSSATLKHDNSANRRSKNLIPRYTKSGSSSPARATPPRLVSPGPDSTPAFTPFAYYPQSGAALQSRSSRSTSGSTSSHSPRQLNLPLLPNRPHTQMRRYVSVPESLQPESLSRSPPPPRRLPDDPNWAPRPRSASSSQPHPTEPSQHQAHSPPLPQVPIQYSQGRRHVSGPSDIQYSNARRLPLPQMPYATPSDPSSLQREYLDEAPGEASLSEDDSDYDNDTENSGVRVDVIPFVGEGYTVDVSSGTLSGRRQRQSLR